MKQLSQFAASSKVWIYQSSRPFNTAEIETLNEQLNAFAAEWTAHNLQLHATGFVYGDRIIILMVDESLNMASGCSIDKSVHFIKQLEKNYDISLFDRMIVNYLENNKIISTTLHEIAHLDPSTLVIDPLVQTKLEFDEHFIVPLKDSWMKQYAS